VICYDIHKLPNAFLINCSHCTFTPSHKHKHKLGSAERRRPRWGGAQAALRPLLKHEANMALAWQIHNPPPPPTGKIHTATIHECWCQPAAVCTVLLQLHRCKLYVANSILQPLMRIYTLKKTSDDFGINKNDAGIFFSSYPEHLLFFIWVLLQMFFVRFRKLSSLDKLSVTC